MRPVVLILTLAGFLLAGTTGHSAAAEFFPEGVPSQNILSGLYPGGDAGGCCWMGPHALFRVVVPGGVNTLIVTIEIPPYAAAAGGTTIAASFGGTSAVARVCCFGVGVHQAAFRLPTESSHDRRLVVRITPSTHFVPAKIGIGTDRRTLSVLLRSVEAVDTLTGARYLDGVAVDTAGRPKALDSVDLVLLLVSGIIIFALVRRRVAFVWVALLVTDPFALTIPTGETTGTLSKVALFAALAALIVRRVSVRSLWSWRFLAIVGAFIAFIASMAISDLHAQYMGAALRETFKAMGYLLTFVVAALAYRVDPDRDLLRRTLAILTIVVSLAALAQIWLGAPEGLVIAGHVVPRIAGPLEGPNQLGAFLGIVLPVLLAFALSSGPRRDEIAALVLGTVALGLTFSRGGLFGFLFACALVFLLRSRGRLAVVVVAAAFSLLLGAVSLHSATSGGGFFTRIFPVRGSDAYNGGLGTRKELWNGAAMMWRSHRVLGIGPGNYQLRISSYAPGVRTHANSYYLQVLAEQGAIGLLALLLLIGTSVRALYQSRDPVAVGMLAVVLAFAFHQIVDCLFLYPKVGDIYWTLVGIAVP